MKSLNRKISSLMVVLSLLSAFTYAQGNDPVLLTISDSKVTLSEFENVYKKNNKNTTAEQTTLEEYLELFIKFKLKVKEAEELGYDTLASFKEELAGYRKQLAKPYLTDKEVKEALIKEAYDRMKTDIKARHILVKVDANALPKDTLEAYNKVMKIRKRVTSGGEDFAKVAGEKGISDDPSAVSNGGDLGYFTALQMVYPFESKAYSTEKGKVSMPVRSRFGYHIIKVEDKRPAMGEILVAHIMVKTKEGTADSLNAKTKVDELYQKVKAGEDFAALARQFSDDKASAKRGGELQWFGTNRMPPIFEKTSFALANNGDISEPIQTRFGWHIVKRLDKKGLAPFEEMEADLKNRVARDSRSQIGTTSKIAKIKKEYGLKETAKTKEAFYTLIDTTYFEGKWKAAEAKAALSKTMFTLGDKKYTQDDFADYLERQQSRRPKMDVKVLVNSMYRRYQDEACLTYEESKLDEKYPEFRALMQEYRDGILLFELTDKKVWSKAIKDTSGLKAFYEQNKENYKWEQRAEATVYSCSSAAIAEEVKGMVAKNKSKDEIVEKINKDSQLNVRAEERKYQKNEDDFIDKNWLPGTFENKISENQINVVVIHKLLAPTVKSLKEAKGIVTSDYQTYLEEEWIKNLKGKYTVEVKKEVLSKVQ